MFIVPKQHPNLADSKYTEVANKLLNNLLKAQADQKLKAPKQAKNRIYDTISKLPIQY